MPRPTKNSAHVKNTSVSQENSIISQESSSSDAEMEVQSPLCFQWSTSQSQPFVQPMFMPYIEGPKMDWTLNYRLYHRFLNWKLKCETILDCELVMLPESKKCMKVIAWSGDFWNGLICVMVLAYRRSQLESYLGQVWNSIPTSLDQRVRRGTQVNTRIKTTLWEKIWCKPSISKKR